MREISVTSGRKMRKKLLVTGASGLLGSKIVEIARKDYRVIPLHNTKPLHPNSVKLDITARKN